MIDNIHITAGGVEYEFTNEAPDDAREQLSDAGDPSNPTVARGVIEQ